MLVYMPGSVAERRTANRGSFFKALSCHESGVTLLIHEPLDVFRQGQRLLVKATRKGTGFASRCRTTASIGFCLTSASIRLAQQVTRSSSWQ